MAIRSNPAKRRSTTPVVDLEARRFIEAAPDDRQTGAEGQADTKPRPGKKVVVMKMSAELVARIDRAADARGLTRTAWCTDRLVTALKGEED